MNEKKCFQTNSQLVSNQSTLNFHVSNINTYHQSTVDTYYVEIGHKLNSFNLSKVTKSFTIRRHRSSKTSAYKNI